MGGAGFGQGLVQGWQQAQDRQLQMQQLKLQQDLAKFQQKHMETQDQMAQLQLQSLQKKIEAETRLPSMQENLLGAQASPLGPNEQGPMPEAAPEIDRRKLVSFLQAAQQAGQDPEHVLSLMAMADPRIQAIHESLKPETLTKLGEDETLVSNRTKQVVAKGKPKGHVIPAGGTFFQEGAAPIQAPPQPERPTVVPAGASVLPPGATTPSFTAPPAPTPLKGPMAVSPGTSLVDPTTRDVIFTAPAAPAKPPDFGDRLESAAASYGQIMYGKPTTFSELLAIDPMKASIVRQQAMVDEPADIQSGKGMAMLPVKEKELLSPTEANELGVPFGTTKGEAKGTMAINAQQRASLAAYDTTRAIMADIEKYSQKVNTAAGGLKGTTQQASKLWGAWTQSDPDAAMLQSKAGELATVARSLGEKGALADKDVARAAALVPGVMDTREVAAQKLRDMRKLIDEGEASFRKSLGMDARTPVKSNRPVPVPQPSKDPLADIPVPKGLSPQQEKVYRQAYEEERKRKQQQMQPKAKK